MKTIVSAFTGRVIEVGAVEDVPAPYLQTGKVTKVWFKDQLTKSGKPDSRKPGSHVGVRITPHNKSADLVFTDDETEAKAAVLRNRIVTLYNELEATRKLLIETYAAIPENQLIDK
jgi:hypothetical protein